VIPDKHDDLLEESDAVCDLIDEGHCLRFFPEPAID
jgi:hypothetical protein